MNLELFSAAGYATICVLRHKPGAANDSLFHSILASDNHSGRSRIVLRGGGFILGKDIAEVVEE